MTAIQGQSRADSRNAAKSQSRSSSAADWSLTGWRSRPALQMPVYPDAAALAGAEARLRRYPPLVFAGEARKLKAALAKVANGEAFLLQGGDCAESFADFTANNIRDTFRVLLQMAVVLTYGAGVPVVKVGRMAGQFAKPRSSDAEKIDGVELPSYRGDIVNGIEFTAGRAPARSGAHGAGLQPVGRDAEPAARLRPGRLCRPARGATAGTSTSSRNSPASARYQDLAARLDETLNFMAACGLSSATTPQIARDRLLHQPRGAAAALRGGADPRRFDLRRLVRLLGAHAVDRRPHPPARRRACRIPARRAQPDRPQVRPDAVDRRPAAPDRHAESGQRGRPHRADRPHGRGEGGRHAAAAGARGRSARASPSSGRAIRCTATPSRRTTAARPATSTRSCAR